MTIKENKVEPISEVLYLVGTPIGNIGDLSQRAKNLLSKVSIIACEDTRHSGQLLKRLEIKSKLISFHKHNYYERIPMLLQRLEKGESLALITDAGLPAFSDPGEELVLATKKAGFKVICIPGPCAATTALVSSGLPSKRFCFEGFIPTKKKERESILSLIAKEQRTTVIYESPHRLIKLLNELSSFCGKDRPLQISRELTKKYEEQIGPTIGKALEHFIKNKPKGEFTLVLGGYPAVKSLKENNGELLNQMQTLIDNGASSSNAAKQIAIKTGLSKNFLYSLIHQNEKKDG